MMIALIVAAAGMILGAGIFLFGWRGRRIGDHPICRRCEFDLFGKPPQSQLCPECGADLDRRYAIVIGVHHRRRGMMLFGVALLVPTLAVGSLLAWGKAHHVQWEKYEPTWMLARQSQSWDPAHRDPALAELMRRFGAGELSKSQIAHLVDVSLAMQAQSERPWLPVWGDLIEQAQKAGDVRDEQWKRYAQQAVAGSCTMLVRATLRPQDPMRITVIRHPPRVASTSRLYAISHLGNLNIDGVDVTSGESNWGSNDLNPRGRGSITRFFAANQPLLKSLALGPHSGYLRVRFELGKDLPPYPSSMPNPEPPIPYGDIYRNTLERERPAHEEAMKHHLFTEVVVNVPLKFELLPSDQPLARPSIDRSMRPKVEASLEIQSLHSSATGSILVIKCGALPVSLCFDVALSDGTREWPLEKMAVPHDTTEWSTIRGEFDGGDGPDAPALDVIFRPNPDAAAFLFDSDISYFNGQVVLKHVPNHWMR